MITSINSSNRIEYNKLFSKAYDTLSGYKKVNKYDENIKAYYYKGTRVRYTSDFKATQEGFNSGTYYIFDNEYEQIAIKSETEFLANRPLYKKKIITWVEDGIEKTAEQYLEVVRFHKETLWYYRRKYVLADTSKPFSPGDTIYYEKTLFYPFSDAEIYNQSSFREQSLLRNQIYIGISFNQYNPAIAANQKDFEQGKYYQYDISSKSYIPAFGEYDINKPYFVRDFTKHEEAISFKLRESVPGFSSDNPIKNLEDYFKWLEPLKSVDIRFSFLPIEEKNSVYFNINANTREIEIPTAFLENGIGVTGDHKCETLHFVIDRYFDMLDLNTTDIYVVWENANGNFGQDLIDIRSVEIDSSGAEKVLFGWPIPQDLTSFEGKIKFSIQFRKKKREVSDMDGNLYTVKSQLNTLPISNTIKFTLSFPHPNSEEFQNGFESGYDLTLKRERSLLQ